MDYQAAAERMVKVRSGRTQTPENEGRVPFGPVHAVTRGGMTACGYAGRLHDLNRDWERGILNRCQECLAVAPIN